MQQLLSVASPSSFTQIWRSMLQLESFVEVECLYRCAGQHCVARSSIRLHHASSFHSPSLCGKGDNRTRRGKIFRNTFREHLPRQFLHPEQFPGGPAYHRAGTHGWREERFRYPCDPSPPAAPSVPGPLGPQ
ncbi:hypothetical protein VaNZ11_004908 [Volvox africanus]|uniref:C2H2-type domain-containing protein n=1 Tax=Volvox africanus TaxID=51714 RepID=A0ABQ5RZ42_9CHLO|nr:hypothetical protein VaNZ11_004908 [Volvox africanus]